MAKKEVNQPIEQDVEAVKNLYFFSDAGVAIQAESQKDAQRIFQSQQINKS
jgi:hypothetical protein